jgi:hypothetical protein
MAQFIILKERISIAPGRTDPAVWLIPVGPWSVGAVQVVAAHNLSGAWTLKVQQSVSGSAPSDFATALSTASAPYMTSPLDLSGVGFLHVSVTTDGTDGYLDVHFVGKSD